jgi:eukaryotic-like serine/threonine-protein kinase
MAIPAGTKFGPYEIQSSLGAGGMGEVYKARDTRLGRTVAIKILPAHLCGTREAKERFDREARSISSVSHPSICHLYDVGAEDGISYLVMEYLEGETLADRLKQGPLPLEQLLKMAIEICEGLETAHRRGVVHRDLKPANIFILPDGHAKLLDFGLATSSPVDQGETMGAADSSQTVEYAMQLTSPGSAVGTIAYMSPEQARGESVDGRSDLFSLGVVIYEMATGHRPFTGPSPATVFDAILNRQPRPVAEINPDLPASIGRLITRLLAKNPRERYASAKEVSEVLCEIQQGRFTTSGKTRVPSRIPSIAVLPFTNLSADPDSHYFSDGLS